MAGVGKGEIVGACMRAIPGHVLAPDTDKHIREIIDGLGRRWGLIGEVAVYVHPALFPRDTFPAGMPWRNGYNLLYLITDRDGQEMASQWGVAMRAGSLPRRCVLYRRGPAN